MTVQHPTPLPWPPFPCWSVPCKSEKPPSHLHGDGPQSSRWPQCAARQLKREHERGEESGSGLGGGAGRPTWSGLCLGPRTDVRICVRSDAHTRPFTPQCTPSPGVPSKNKHPPHASHVPSTEWEWKRKFRQSGDVRHTTNSSSPTARGQRNFL